MRTVRSVKEPRHCVRIAGLTLCSEPAQQVMHTCSTPLRWSPGSTQTLSSIMNVSRTGLKHSVVKMHLRSYFLRSRCGCWVLRGDKCDPLGPGVRARLWVNRCQLVNCFSAPPSPNAKTVMNLKDSDTGCMSMGFLVDFSRQLKEEPRR